MNTFHDKNKEEIFDLFKTSGNGLSSQEANLRLHSFGQNKLREKKKQSILAKFFAQFKDVMIILLLVSAGISLVFSFVSADGKSELIDAIIIFAIVIINASLGVFQEVKAENAMESLKKLSSPYSKVIRNGKEEFVKTSDLVVGDVVILEAGDVVPADLRLIESASLKCDESALTGESNAVEKDCNLLFKEKTPIGDRKNMCYSTSSVVYGRGVGVVVATGINAEIGKIAEMLNNDNDNETSTLQASLNKFGKIITVVVLAIAFVIFLVDLFCTTLHWSESLMTAVAIAVAAIPESLMVVVTIILSMGVTKLSKKNVIIRRLHSVETLGCCEIICSDKTGTITQNKMTVRNIYVNNAILSIKDLDYANEATKQLINNMAYCNDAKKQDKKYLGDPTETALIEAIDKLGLKVDILRKKYNRVNEIPFDSNRKLMTTLMKNENNLFQYTKGAVDELLKTCSKILIDGKVRNITKKDIDNIKSANSELCGKALRVLGFAYKECKNGNEMSENKLTFIGMVGMIDPPREEVYDALEKCKNAGMQAVMITGDHKNTAYAIAKELGIVDNINEVTDGIELDKFSDEELKTEIWKYKVFTRVSPEHKVRIVKAFRANGKVVAMTGDGVNDAPSIKSANIGIGMGKSGTEVTKEVADMILTDDNFATIVVAVEEGRKIYTNIQKTIQFLLSCNIAEVVSIFVLTLLFPTVPFLVAVQILFINLITDTLPAIALGMEDVEFDVMKKKPRKMKDNIIGGKIGFNIIYQGILQSILVVGVYLLANNLYGSTIATTMGFLTLNILQLIHMYNVRTNHSVFKSNPLKNKAMSLAFVVGFGLLLTISLIPFLANIFHLVQLNIKQWILVILFSLIIVPIVEIVKFVQNRIYIRRN